MTCPPENLSQHNVKLSKSDGRIETREYRGEERICQASGPDFRKAMIHATITGLEEVNQRTKKPKTQMGQTAQLPYSCTIWCTLSAQPGHIRPKRAHPGWGSDQA
jgi:hypothetical protein